MLKRISTIGGMTLVSRLFGFIRDVLMAAYLGAGPLADAFMVAFRLPNHFRAIFGEGAFNAAFVPTYSGLTQTDTPQTAQKFAGQILSLLILSQIILLAIAWVATPAVVHLLAPGFASKGATFDLTIELTRITFPYLALITAVTLVSGVLNAHDRFAAAAFAPTLLNFAMIGALLTVSLFPTAAHGLAWAVLVSGLLQLAMVWFDLARGGLSLKLERPTLTPQVRTFFRRFGPAVLGSAGVQIALFADTILASFLPAGSVSYLYYADRLYQLPLAIIGIAIGTALLPELSKLIAAGRTHEAQASQRRAMGYALALALPCSIAFLICGFDIMRLLFGRGAFDVAAIAGSTHALAAYAWGIPAFILMRSVVPAFHARGDTATPVKVLFVATLVNVALKLVLTGPLLHAGLALATSVAAWINMLGLTWLLIRRGQFTLGPNAFKPLIIMIVASLAMAALLMVDAPALATALFPTLALPWSLLLFIKLGGAGLLYFGILGAVYSRLRR